MERYREENVSLNSFQTSAMLFKAKLKYLIAGRATGKSFINGAEVDENVRLMPRGITTVTQDTPGQALTKTLPSTFKFPEMPGYKRYDPKTKTGDYAVCQKPPAHFYEPYERLMSYEHVITFSSGHALYLLSRVAGARGPNAGYSITGEALTIDRVKFDRKAAATNRGNEEMFGFRSKNPVYKHHGSAFTSSTGFLPEHKWMTEPAQYYADEAGIQLFAVRNKTVNLQLQLIQAKIANGETMAVELFKESVRLRRTITPFVSGDGVLFMLSNAFDNIHNTGFNCIARMYRVMDIVTFMIEILNFHLNKVTDCYYSPDDRHVYYKADNDGYIRGIAENNSFNWDELQKRHSLYDADCDTNRPIEITPDNGFFVKPDDSPDTMINLLMDKFCEYCRYHKKKEVIHTVDTCGDLHLASSKKTCNEHAIARLKKNRWKVTTRKHPGKEPPHNDRYLLWRCLLHETEPHLPLKRFSGVRCKCTLVSMNSTPVIQKPNGKFEKDRRSEARTSVLPEEATHFGDAVNKRMWTKYGQLLKGRTSFIMPRL